MWPFKLSNRIIYSPAISHETWRPGDVAGCIGDGPWSNFYGNPSHGPEYGSKSIVVGVARLGNAQLLILAGWPGEAYCAASFRKIIDVGVEEPPSQSAGAHPRHASAGERGDLGRIMPSQQLVPVVMGRPLSFTQALGNEICERIALGESLRSITRGDDMPEQKTVYRWLLRDDMDEFRQQYRHARELQADTFYDEIPDIADDSTNDYMERERKDGSLFMAFDSENVQRSRLRIDSRKWLAAVTAPKKYGDKIQVEGRNQSVTHTIAHDATDEQAALEYQKLIKGE